MPGSKHYTEEQLLEGLRRQDNQVLEFMYRDYRPIIRLLIYQRGGSWDDAKDIFQDAMIELIKMTADLSYNPKCKMKTLLYAISKNLWSKRLRRIKREQQFTIPDHDIMVEAHFPEQGDMELYENLFWSTFKDLPETCRKVLKLYWDNLNPQEISKLLNRTEGYVRKRKSTCTERFVDAVKSHKEYVRLTKSTIDIDSERNRK